MNDSPRDGDSDKERVRATAAAAARLLGLGAPPPTPSRASGDEGVADLGRLVSRMLGVERASGEQTLMRIDNRALREALEEQTLLGLGAIASATFERLREATLVLAGGAMPAQRRMSIDETRRQGLRLLCAFTDRAALLASHGAKEGAAWALPSARVAEFALGMGYDGCILDPGASHEIVLGADALRRLRASAPQTAADG